MQGGKTMKIFKIFCFILGGIYLLHSMPQKVKADWGSIGSSLGAAAGAVQQHVDQSKKKGNNAPAAAESED